MTEWPLRHCPCSYWPLVKVDRGMSVALNSSMSSASCLLGTAIWKDLAFVIRPGLHLPTMHSWKGDKDPVSNTGPGWWEEPAMISYHQHCHQHLSSPQESSFSIRPLLSSVPLSVNTGFLSLHSFSFAFHLGEGQNSVIWETPPARPPNLTKITLQHGHTPHERPGVNVKTLKQFSSLAYSIMRLNYYINQFMMLFLLNGLKHFGLWQASGSFLFLIWPRELRSATCC